MLGEWKLPFRALIDAAPDGVVVCDERGTLALVNDVAEVLAEVVHTLEPMAARARIQIAAATVAPGTPRVVADRTRPAQILMNLGSNAMRGSIAISPSQ